MILAAKMMLEWIGERYSDQTCLKAAEVIEAGVVSALKKGLAVPDLGGGLKTVEMGEAIANEIAEFKI
jgi:isocitrate/isopropylmalate dehydrogenase